MKFLIVFAALVALAAAGPLLQNAGQRQSHEGESVVVVKEQLHNNIGLDGYQFNYELSDGQKREESAELTNAGSENAALVVKGSYSWVDANGQEYIITYIADENGFQPQGAHIPA